MELTSILFTLLCLVGLALASPMAPPFNNTSDPRAVLVGDEILLNDKINAVNRLMFDTSLDDFLEARHNNDPPYVDWSSNGCTSSPDKPLHFNFVKACKRHDFGYQNFRAINRWNHHIRQQVDRNFKKDLFGICDELVEDFNPICYGLTMVYYSAVRLFGGDDKASRNVIIVEDKGAIVLQVDGVEKERVDGNTTFWGGKLWQMGVQDAQDELEETMGPLPSFTSE